MGWFNRRNREHELLTKLLEAENSRIAAAAALEQEKLRLEQRRMELEFEHLEASSEQKRLDREAAQKLREDRKRWSAEHRQKKAQEKGSGGHVSGMPQTFSADCPACRNPSDPRLTAEEIKRHHAHLAATPRLN